MIRIHILHGSKKGRRLDFNKDIIYIGRSKDNDIQMNNLTVSRNHLKIMNKRGRYFIEDLNSTNGTYLDGEYIEPGTEIEVKEGLPVIIGHMAFSLAEAYPDNVPMISDDLYLPQAADKNRKHAITDNHVEYIDKRDLMCRICNVLMNSINITQALEKILEYIFDHIHALDRGAFVLIDEDTGKILEIISRLRNRKSARMYSRTLVKRVFQEGKTIFMSNNTNRKINFLESMEIYGLNSVICMPLKRNSKTYGVIYGDSVDKTTGFTRKDFSILTAIIGPTLILIENAWLNATGRIKRQNQPPRIRGAGQIKKLRLHFLQT